MADNNDSKPLIENRFTHYRRRWYLLLVYSLLQAIAGFSNNIWRSSTINATFAFQWNTANFLLIMNWTPIIGLVICLPYAWLLRVKGLRHSILISSGFLTVGTGIMSITSELPYVTATVHVGQICIAVSNIITFVTISAFVTNWFPSGQSPYALAIAELAVFVGGALPSMVLTALIDVNLDVDPEEQVALSKFIRNRFMYVIYTVFGSSALISLLILIYFPSHPPSPASEHRVCQTGNMLGEFRSLLSYKSVSILCITYGLTNGTYWTWNALADAIFFDVLLDFPRHQLNTLLYSATGVYVLGLLIFGTCLQMRLLKTVLLCCYGVALVCMTWLILDCTNVIPSGVIYNFAIPSVILPIPMTLMVPIVYMLAFEMSDPIPEDISNAVLTWTPFPVQVILFLILLIPNVHLSWLNWTILFNVTVSFIAVALCKVQFNRKTQGEEGVAMEILTTK